MKMKDQLAPNGRVTAVQDATNTALVAPVTDSVRHSRVAVADTNLYLTEEYPVERTVFPNGLTVLSEFVRGTRAISLGAWIQGATLQESRSKMGISHMLEHLVFKGTANRSARDISFALESVGGSLDAYTAREHTSYQGLFLREHLGTAANVLHDVIFSPALRSNDLQLEKNVILEEIAMVEDTPDDLVFEIHNEELWGDNGYGYQILGTRETVESLTSDDLIKLHRSHYVPENIVVVGTGAISHAQLVDNLAENGWAAAPGGGRARIVDPVPPPVISPVYSHFDREGAQTHIVLGTRLFSCKDGRRDTHSLISTVLGGGMSSRLFQRIREELGLAYSIYTFSSLYARDGMHGIYVGTGPDTANDAVKAILDELHKISEFGLTSDELESGKRQLKGQITLSLEGASARMYRAAENELYNEPYRTLDETLALIDQIDEVTVSEVCKTFFAPDLQTVVSLGPTPVECLSKG